MPGVSRGTDADQTTFPAALWGIQPSQEESKNTEQQLGDSIPKRPCIGHNQSNPQGWYAL